MTQSAAHLRGAGEALQASLVDARSVPAALLAQWDALEREALEPNPFFCPAMVLPAVRHLAPESGVELLVVHEGDELVFLAPVRRRVLPLGLPAPGLVAWMHPYCYLGTPLVSAARPVEAWGAVLDLLGRRGVPSWCVLPLMATDGPVADALSAAVAGRSAKRVASASQGQRALLVPTDGRGPEAGMSKGTRRRLRRHRSDLSELDGSSTSLHVGRDVVRLGLVDRFLTLEASGWKGRRGSALASDPRSRRFFAEMCEAFAERERLLVFDLAGEQGSHAMLVSLAAGPGLFDLKTAYDERLAEHRPGTVVRLDAARMVAESGEFAFVDSCAAPDSEWAKRLYPQRRPLARVLVGGGRGPGRLAVLVAPGWLRTRSRVRRLVLGRLEAAAALRPAAPAAAARRDLPA